MEHNYVIDGNTQIPSSQSENNDEVPIWTIFGEDNSSLENQNYLSHPHILQARILEKYYDLFKVFSIHNNETITMCLAAFKTLTCETPGIFTKEEALDAINYLSSDLRNEVFSKLFKYNWIISNGIRYEIPTHARAFGKYLNPEQVDEFIEKASIDILSKLVKKRFASPRIVFHISKEEILLRGIAYLQRKPEIQEPTPPPPIAEIEKRQVIVSSAEGDINEFYRELQFSLERKPVIPLPEVVVKNTFGQSLYRTGLLVTIRNEISLTSDKQQFELVLED